VNGKVAWVTGAAGGIGSAVVRAFRAAGAEVFGVDLEPGEHVERQADLTVEAQVAEAVASCLERHGRIDVAFNGAGGSARRFGDGPVHDCTEEGFDAAVAINLKSVFLCCKHTIRALRKTRGSVVNLSSIQALVGAGEGFETHAYAAAKGGIVALTRAMAVSYAPDGVRCNAICPGLVRTPMSRRAQGDEAILARLGRLQPLTGDFAEPEDVAGAALYLATSRFVTGVVLPVDGGWTAQ
jgi:NAD(P)-dependent dehydrogenase (short-subunit alcohol dehydrogenase family)